MDHFALFGLSPSVDVDVPALERKYRELSLAYHPDRNPNDRVGAASRTASLNEAFKVLKDPVKRAFYVLSQKGIDLERVSMPMEFLEKILERREELDGARAKKDLLKARELAAVIGGESDEALRFGLEALRRDDLTGATALLAKVRYYARFLEEVEAMEEDAA